MNGAGAVGGGDRRSSRRGDERDARPLDELAADHRRRGAARRGDRGVAGADRGVRPARGLGRFGIRSCAHWLAWQCGLSTGTAREHVRVARALAELPATAAAFAGGGCPTPRSGRSAGSPTRPPRASLLELAHETTASQLERAVREWRRRDEEATRRARSATGRRFDHWSDEDGHGHIRLCRTPRPARRSWPGSTPRRTRGPPRTRAARRPRRRPTHEAIRRGRDPDTPDGAPARNGPADDDEVFLARERTTARRCAALGRLVAGRRRRPTAAPATRPAGRSSCTSTPRCSPTTPPPAAPTSRAGRRCTPPRSAGCCARPPFSPCSNAAANPSPTAAPPLRHPRPAARPVPPRPRLRPPRLPRDPPRTTARPPPAALAVRRRHRRVEHGPALRHRPRPGPRRGPHPVPPRRPARRLTQDGRRVWGRADAAFAAGIDGSRPDPESSDDAYAASTPSTRPSVGVPRRRPPMLRTSRRRGVSAGTRRWAPARSTGPAHRRRGRAPGTRGARRGGQLVPVRPGRRAAGARPDGPHGARRRRADAAHRPAGAHPPTAVPLSAAAESDRLDRILFPDGARRARRRAIRTTTGWTWPGRSPSSWATATSCADARPSGGRAADRPPGTFPRERPG